MPTPDNTVSLLVGGKAHSRWSSYSVDSDLQIPADAWQVALGLPDGDLPDIVVPGADVEVRIGNDTVMSGKIDAIEEQLSHNSHTLRINGRNGAAVLVDCSAALFSSKQISLKEIVEKVVKPLGIKKVQINAKDTQITEKVSIDPGMTAWQVLSSAAEANGLWAWFEPDGTLIVGGPDYSKPVVASLSIKRDGKGNNVESLTRSQSIAGCFSSYTVLAQSHGTHSDNGKHAISRTTSDKDILEKAYRPKIVIDSDAINEESAQIKGKKLMADARLKGFTITATVHGHRTENGVLWTPGQRVSVFSEVHGINGDYFLMARRFEGGRGRGTITTLTLKEDSMWIVDARKVPNKKTPRKNPVVAPKDKCAKEGSTP